MQEKAMVADALNTINSSLKTYTDMISQTDNQKLRGALQQMRNEAEQSQYELYTIAKNMQYYQPACEASEKEINSLKAILAGSTGNVSGNTNASGGIGQADSSGVSGNDTMTDYVSKVGMDVLGMAAGSGMTGGTTDPSNSSIAGGWSLSDVKASSDNKNSFRDLG